MIGMLNFEIVTECADGCRGLASHLLCYKLKKMIAFGAHKR